ncbi:hypothetical protein [Nocardia concava]|uniref:hypothetical protein n=1 Tax=Nocardia concava TaxID=257281 RepID=UPI000301D8EC|nr:hypothetical protein [Nocardia concava]
MHTGSRSSRRIAWAASLVGVAGTLTTLSPGLAAAGIHGIEVEQCDAAGRNCGTPASIVAGQTYWIEGPYDGVSITGPTNSFYDNGSCIGGGGYSVFWVPATAGTHTLSTIDTKGFKDSVTVTVVAAPAGSPVAQQPQQGGCGGGGSFGSGSADLLGSGSAGH